MSEKYILTVKSGLHFGHIKETFGAGAVIEYDDASKVLTIDGRKFQDTRDLDILKRQAAKFPDRPWIVPFSPKKLEEVLGGRAAKVSTPPKPRPGENMKVVKSDEDLTEPIDIKDTQISKRNQEAKEAQRNKVKSDKLEVVRGDESVEERIARLKDKTDIGSKAERARLMATTPAKMPIVKDDSLGASVGRSAVPLNAGQPLPSRELVEAKSEEARAIAEARKREASLSRKSGDEDVQSEGVADGSSSESVEEPSGSVVEVGDGDADIAKDAEIAMLKAKIAELEARNSKPPTIRRPVAPQPRTPAGEPVEE